MNKQAELTGLFKVTIIFIINAINDINRLKNCFLLTTLKNWTLHETPRESYQFQNSAKIVHSHKKLGDQLRPR